MKKSEPVHLLVIDPQVDFMDIPGSALPVPGAKEDMNRLALMIELFGHRIGKIMVTLDTHHTYDVGHSVFWRNAAGDVPSDFTAISADDIASGTWVPRDKALTQRMLKYAEKLERTGKYQIMVWPNHCLIGSPGHNVWAELRTAFRYWEINFNVEVDYVLKGLNAYTEHYGALMAEVPDPKDSGTLLNASILHWLRSAGVIAIAGEALSHCFRSTVDQIADHIGDEYIGNIHLLTDCTSSVPKTPGGPDFPAISKTWLAEMEKRGMVLTTSAEFLP